MLESHTKKEQFSVRIPEIVMEKVDELVGEGFYSSRSEFVSSAIRHTLVFYSELRGMSSDVASLYLRRCGVEYLPKPIQNPTDAPKSEPFDTGFTSLPEDRIADMYRAVTRTFFELFKGFKGQSESETQVSYRCGEGV
jgi:hypothetical protein